jgi:hypothetical protein
MESVDIEIFIYFTETQFSCMPVLRLFAIGHMLFPFLCSDTRTHMLTDCVFARACVHCVCVCVYV